MAAVWTGIALLALHGYAQPQARAAGSFEQLSRQADQARDAEDLDRAIPLYRRALTLRPQWGDGWWSLGTIYYDRDAYADAAGAFQKLVVVDPKNGAGRSMLGLCQFELGQDDKALQNIQEGRRVGIRKNDELRKVLLYHEGLLLLRKSKFSSAQKALTLLARDGVEEKSAALALGMAVLLIHPSKLPPEGSLGYHVVLHAGEAEMLAANKKPDEGKKRYAAAVEAAPGFPNLHYAWGRFLLDLNETDQAIAEFQQEIRNNPKHVQANLEIAAVRYRVDSADGVKYAEEAVRLAPRMPFAHYLLGLVYLDTGNLSKAIPQLQIAKKAFPNEANVYFALGTAYARSGRKLEAARARAMFTKLNAAKKEEDSPTTYGQQSSGLDQQRFGHDPGSPPQK